MPAAHPTHLFLLDFTVPVSHKSTYYQAPHYNPTPPPALLLVAPRQVQLFFSAPVLKHIQCMVFL